MEDDFFDDSYESDDIFPPTGPYTYEIPLPDNEFPDPLQENVFLGSVHNNPYEQLLNESNEEAFFEHLKETEPILKDVVELLSRTYDIEISGDPIGNPDFFDRQDGPNSCAIATASMILRNIGYDFGEDFLADYFQQFGAYDPEFGTDSHSIADAINVLSELTNSDFNATEINHFTIDELKQILDSGDKILVGVDSHELYYDSDITLNEIRGIPDSGHAIQLIGIIRNGNDTSVVLNDPGIENGAGITVPLDRFLHSSDDFNYTAIRVA
ncbi:hypothetical protein DSCO28_02760 [Desulfosarcina ovata subsp. sediminis]|uniref:Peptidase C39-like domain-containing protein n=1 Tax=Desulfosarcina ovata subsp. sediminis TaxID=885957 RepID=A0A5K7ZMK0_9BACT|nr:C39 family peptidase [Desulfosarcina ovata]BBO79710.1 hypothetical protein DSCO28_02760 [Desulfosarcina ovata subsp. sediminis]